MIIPSAPDFLESLLQHQVLLAMKRLVESLVHYKSIDEVITDSYGSCAAKVLTQKDAPTILIEAHCDEIGMVVQHITEKGLVA